MTVRAVVERSDQIERGGLLGLHVQWDCSEAETSSELELL
jgi:hypothetical protein